MSKTKQQTRKAVLERIHAPAIRALLDTLPHN
jgi:hypothetical protein